MEPPPALPLPDGRGFRQLLSYRVHIAPEIPPRLRRPEEKAQNRFDDPHNRFRVRYAGDSTYICLLETMSRFRDHGESEELLAGITGVDDNLVVDDPASGGAMGGPAPHSKLDAITEWLASQRLGTVHLLDQTSFVDLRSPTVWRLLDEHPHVRHELDAWTEIRPDDDDKDDPVQNRRAHVDGGLIRLGGRRARAITQQISAAAWESFRPDFGGIRYPSRLDDSRTCWAIWEEVAVRVTSVPLDAENRAHRRPMHRAARLLGLPLPSDWEPRTHRR